MRFSECYFILIGCGSEHRKLPFVRGSQSEKKQEEDELRGHTDPV